MRAVVLTHINKFCRATHHLECRLDHRLRLADKRDHGAVGGLARVHIEQFDTLCPTDNVGYLVYHFLVATLTEIGHTFNQIHNS